MELAFQRSLKKLRESRNVASIAPPVSPEAVFVCKKQAAATASVLSGLFDATTPCDIVELVAGLDLASREVLCWRALTRFAKDSACDERVLARYRDIARLCAPDLESGRILLAACDHGIQATVVPLAERMLREQISLLETVAWLPSALRQSAVEALPDGLAKRGWQVSEVRWLQRELTSMRGAVTRGDATVRAEVWSSLARMRERLSSVHVPERCDAAVALVGLRRELNEIFRARYEGSAVAPELRAKPPSAFDRSVNRSVALLLDTVGRKILTGARQTLSLGSVVHFGGRWWSDGDRASGRLNWLKLHTEHALDFVFWYPPGRFRLQLRQDELGGIVRSIPDGCAFRGVSLPLLIRADFARGCVLVSLEKQAGLALEICEWTSDGPLPPETSPDRLLSLRKETVMFPKGWEAMASIALRSRLLD